MREHFLGLRKPIWTRKKIERGLIFTCLVLLCLIGLITLNATWFWVSGKADSLAAVSAPKAAGPKSATQPPSQPLSPALSEEIEARVNDAKKDLEARNDEDWKHANERIAEKTDGSQQLLDKLITLVSVYTVFLGFAALFTLKNARDEAKEQVETIRKQADENVQKYQQNFPEFTGMHERVQQLMREMERRLPSEEDWNNDDSFRKLSEADRQYIVDSELTVAAMSIFDFGKSPKLKPRLSSIYAVFARFYIGRYRTLAEDSESDFLRAVSYAGRVIDLNPDGGAGYRLRGAIHLARYERLAKASPPAGASALEQSLAKAELDLSEAIQKGTAESVDAGAYYNQALVRYYRGDIEGAVRVSRQLLGLESKISRLQREKYLPSIYVNLGSFLAKLAKRAAEENQLDAVRQFSSQAVEAIARGVEDFKKTEMQDGGLARLKELLRSELDSNQELNGLGQTYRDQLEVLLGGGAANGSQSNPEKRS
jgi:hypothetical protein